MTKAVEVQDYPFVRWQRFTNQLDPPYSPHYINSTAISADGGRVIAGTYYHDYSRDQGTASTPAPGEISVFGTYCFDRDGKQLWVDEFVGFEGVYVVAISEDGTVAASGGWYKYSPNAEGFVRAYDVGSGPSPIVDFKTPERVNALAISHDGSTLVAGSDKLYLFQQTNGVYPAQPSAMPLMDPPTGSSNNVQSVAITYDGNWIVAGDLCGNVYLVENVNGSLGKPYVWSDRTLLYTIHSVAMAANGSYFAVGGSGSAVYIFDPRSIEFGPLTYAGEYQLDTGGRVGWVAISADGNTISAVGNRKGQQNGAVVLIQNNQGTLAKLWEANTDYNPNCTSMDSEATYVCVADGYNTPGTFSLFDGKTGSRVWQYPTPKMNWPMFISTDGSGIAGGTDDGSIFYFTVTMSA